MPGSQRERIQEILSGSGSGSAGTGYWVMNSLLLPSIGLGGKGEGEGGGHALCDLVLAFHLSRYLRSIRSPPPPLPLPLPLPSPPLPSTSTDVLMSWWYWFGAAAEPFTHSTDESAQVSARDGGAWRSVAERGLEQCAFDQNSKQSPHTGL